MNELTCPYLTLDHLPPTHTEINGAITFYLYEGNLHRTHTLNITLVAEPPAIIGDALNQITDSLFRPLLHQPPYKEQLEKDGYVIFPVPIRITPIYSNPRPANAE